MLTLGMVWCGVASLPRPVKSRMALVCAFSPQAPASSKLCVDLHLLMFSYFYARTHTCIHATFSQRMNP